MSEGDPHEGEGPLISIVTATLNNLSGLIMTAESIAGQDFSDFEHLVIDGGSTDGTVEWLESSPLPIKWVSEPDQGIADALNKGLRMAGGQWILVLHAEDTFADSESLSSVVPYLGADAGIVSSDVLFVIGHEERRWRSRGWAWKTNFKTTIPHQGALVHRSVFEQLGGFNVSYRVALDYDFFLRAYRNDVAVELTYSVLSRMPATGLSSQLDWQSLRARFAEERRAHAAQRPHFGWRAVYAVYWPAYLTCRRLRDLLRLVVLRETR